MKETILDHVIEGYDFGIAHDNRLTNSDSAQPIAPPRGTPSAWLLQITQSVTTTKRLRFLAEQAIEDRVDAALQTWVPECSE